MRSLPAAIAAIFTIAASLHATDFPTIKTAMPDIDVNQGSTVPAIDFRNFFEVTSITGQVVQFRTSQGTYNVEMLPAAAPLSVANFLNYVNGGRYVNTFIHRVDLGLGVIQGGGYTITTPSPLAVDHIATDPPVVLEYNLPNTRGTLSMARTAALNSGTSEWFVNTDDNTVDLGAGNNGGYAVFGRVTGTGMTVVDAIAALTIYNFGGAFGTLPLTGYSGTGNPLPANFINLNGAESVPIFPASAGQNAVVTFSVTNNTNPALVTPVVSASGLSLALAPGVQGFADITVAATDTHGNAVQETFRLNVTAGPTEIVVEQPAGSDIADGGSRAFPLVNVGSAVSLTFTIKNNGSGNLTLTGTPRVAVDGANAGEFTVVTPPGSPVLGSGSTTFAVRFAPTSSGAKAAALHIASDDGDENPFDINLTGTANARPTLSLPGSPLIAAPASASGAVVTFQVTANDAEDGPLTPTVTPPSGSAFSFGDTTVEVRATDSNGAQTTASFTVRVGFPRPGSPSVNEGGHSADLAPAGPPAGTRLSAFGAPAISDFRTMAARVTMLSGRTLLSGIYVEDGAGVATLPAFQGGPAPGVSTAGTTFRTFGDPVIAPGGSIAFLATLQGGGVRLTEDFGVWTNAFGSGFELVLREGQPVPDLPGTTLRSVVSVSLRDGELLALIALTPTRVVTAANDLALVRMSGATTGKLLLREGGDFANSRIRTFSVLGSAAGSAGHGRWQADGATVAKIALTDGRSLIVKIAPDGTATPMLSTADPATAVNAAARWIAFGLPAVGSEGANFVVAAALRQRLGAVGAADDFALLTSPDGTEWNVFAREGDEAPDGALYSALLDPVVNDAGQVAFIAVLNTLRNRVGIFAGLPGAVAEIARLGEHPPGEATAVWSRFLTCALPGGPDAGVVFLAETAGGDTTLRNKLALWAVDSQGTLRRLLRTGDTLAAGGPPIAGLTLMNAVPGAFGATRSFNAAGSIALVAIFADRSQALLRVDIP